MPLISKVDPAIRSAEVPQNGYHRSLEVKLTDSNLGKTSRLDFPEAGLQHGRNGS